jgi:hypothetical protein
MKKPSRKIVFTKLAIIFAAALLAVFGFTRYAARQQVVLASATGPSPSHTNAPGESNCTACHSDFVLNSGTGNIGVTGLPANYLPNQQIPVTLTINHATAVVFGFQLTMIDEQGRNVGSFTIPGGPNAPMQTDTGPVDGNTRTYLEHTEDGITPTMFDTKSWTFTWNTPAQRVGKVTAYFAGNAANGNGQLSGDYIYTSSKSTLSGSAISSFEGDGKSDVAVWRPSDGTWYSLDSANGGFRAAQFGTSGDKIAPGDYDGDGKTDYAVFRPSEGNWYLLQSTAGFTGLHFGLAGDIPVQGDYDGDLKTDIAVFRPSEGNWYVLFSTGGFTGFHFGLPSDKPVQGDFDADGKTDFAVFRPSEGNWYLLQSTAGFSAVHFGISEDKPVQGDYDGDGKTDHAVFRPSEGNWYVLFSTGGFTGFHFGASADVPAPADFDGDGKTDFSVFRPSEGNWYMLQSTAGFSSTHFGSPGDIPVPGGYIFQ